MDEQAVAAELLRVPPNEFVAARNARVAELKAAGERELAGAVAKLRRHSAAEWALNVIAHEHPDLVADWAAAAADARAAQEAPSANLRQALADWRAATAVLVRAAPRGAPKGDLTAELTQIGGAPEATARFVAGLLGAGGEPPALADAAPRRTSPRRSASATPNADAPNEDRKAAQRKEKALAAARRAVEQAEADAESAEREATDADAALDAAVDAVEAARAALAAAEQECDRAKRRAIAAGKLHDAARVDLNRAQQALATAHDA